MKTLIFIKFALCLFAMLLLFPHRAMATHNRAGEIIYEHAPLPGEPYRYIFTIITYTKFSGASADADRDELEIFFGDGTSTMLPRINGNGTIIDDDIKRNDYQGTHSYAAAANYVVSMQDPNRIDEIININFGVSVDIPFYLEDTLFILDPQFFGFNSSPILYQPPINTNANVGYPFEYNPNAWDPDGDSLCFLLIAPKASEFDEVPLYQFPDEVLPGAENNVSLDPVTGDFLWDAPQQPGIYNVAFLIKEFRNGVLIGTMIRDMQIIVDEVDNRPPEIEPINDTCFVIGDILQIPVTATDPDEGQRVTLTAFGGPFEPGWDATFPEVNGINIVNGTFIWDTDCSHIYSEEYTIVFEAQDNFVHNSSPLPLTDIETWQITLLPPPPEELQAEVLVNSIKITWNTTLPYLCENDDKFRGFSVWRSGGCDDLEFECKAGLTGTGYVKLAEGITDHEYLDDTAIRGLNYSYRVIADFADFFTSSNPPSPVNPAASVPSENVCAELPKNVPIITNVSIDTVKTPNAEVYVAWSKPRDSELDTLQNPGPYTYELYRSQGFGGGSYDLIATFTANEFWQANDTIYFDNDVSLNTQENPYSYKVAFLIGGELVDETETASSVYLNINYGDNVLFLTWNFAVPWLNTNYNIYRENPALGHFELIGSTTFPSFVDPELKNGSEYCYYIEAVGTYDTEDIVDPLINYSQIACGVPLDTVPPCAPDLLVSNECENDVIGDDDINFINFLTWEDNNAAVCPDDDIVIYRVYYSSPLSPDYVLLDSTASHTFEHELEGTIAGCYAVTAVDSFYNESVYSNIVCVENCVAFELPNVFTPNGDSQNELFVPRKSRFVSSIDMRIFNRWGNLVYTTTDPLINWNGTNENNGKELAEGIYYYVVDVFEQTSDGVEVISQSLKGEVMIIRGNN